MTFIRLCQTRETLPQEVEHYFNAHTHQSHRWGWQNRQFFALPSPHHLFEGAKITERKVQTTKSKYWLTHRRSPIFPIKRYKQFEDRDQKLRLNPTDLLIQELKKQDHIEFIIHPLSKKTQDRLRKRIQSPSFKLNSRWDLFETWTWHKLSFRNLFGKLWRWSRSHVTHTHDAKQSKLHDREGPMEAILDKFSRPLFHLEIRCNRPFQTYAQSFALPHLGELQWSKKPQMLLLSSEELATLISPPSSKALRKIPSEACAWLPGDPHIPLKDRLKHLHIIGKTGMGKSTALIELFQNDLRQFPQIMIMDPHGDLIEKALKIIPGNKKLILLDPSNRDFPLALNPLELKKGENLEQKSSSLLEMFYALSKGSWGPRLEYILRNTLLTLLLCPNTSILDIPRILTRPEFTKKLAHQCADMELQRFWFQEFLATDARLRHDMIAPILNKVGPLLSTPLLRNIFGQPKSKFNFDQILTEPGIILVPLSKGKLGEDASRLLGMTLISMLQGSLLRREKPTPLALSLDEFQNFATPTLMTMLSESRKFGLALTLAHQYIKQVPEEIMDAVLGNVGSHIVLRSCFEDAERLAPLLQVETEDLINLPELNAYVKTIKEGVPQSSIRHEFRFVPQNSTSPPPTLSFGRPRALVEAKLKSRYNKDKILTRQ